MWNYFGVILLFLHDERMFSWTSKGIRSLSTKKQSVLSDILIPLNYELLRSFLAESKLPVITEVSFVWLLLSPRAFIVILFETVWKVSWRYERICLMSFWKFYTNTYKALSSPSPPSCLRIYFSLLTTRGFEGLWKEMSRQWLARLLIFSWRRSLQIQIMGTFVFLIIWMMAVIPPLSPELIPSTSSIMIKGFCRLLEISKFSDELYIKLTPLLFLISLALNSDTI